MAFNLVTLFPLTNKSDTVVVVVGCAFLVYVIFKHFEPARPLPVICLLFVIPAGLSQLLRPFFNTVLATILTYLIYHTTILTCVVSYRLSPYHPLATYPGPLLAKISQLWFTYHGYSGRQHLVIQALHNKLGDVVRIGPNELSIRDPSAITPLLGPGGASRGPGMTGRIFYNPIPSFISIRDHAYHAQRKKPWTRALNTSSLKFYEPIIAKRVVQLVDLMLGQNGSTFNCAEKISYFTYDFMSDMVFGDGSEMMEEGDKDGTWEVVTNGLRVAMIVDHLPWSSRFLKHIPGFADDVKHLRAFGMSRASARIESGSKTKDLFYYLSNDDGAEKVDPPKAVVISDGTTAIIAGSDTTSGSLSNILYYLCRYPEVYKKLQDEVDEFFPSGEDAFDTKQYHKMTYLDAIMNESLRLWPAGPSGSQRTVKDESGGRFIGPYFIATNTQARIHTYSVHRDPRNFFPNPDTFWPERWLIAEGILSPPSSPPSVKEKPYSDDESKSKLESKSPNFTHNTNAFIPFSFGPTSCVGKNLAILEMKMVLCYCLQKVCFKFDPNWDFNEWEKGLVDYFVLTRGELPLIVEERK
ncbi:cytochrome P450 [Abortiporus biennis]|nr:cytochrome P450 [Abortiporus biennis]